VRYDFRLSAKFHTGFRLRRPLLHRIQAGLAFVYKLIRSFHRRFQILNFTLPYFRNKKGRMRRRQISLPLAATQLPCAKARRSLNLSFSQALDIGQKLAGRLANFAS